jgi:hypothetical protein
MVNGVQIGICDANWNFGNYTEYPMQFKVVDENGKGVPGIDVLLWPDQFPDYSRYTGYLCLNSNNNITRNNPLTLKTDANGIVTLKLSYFCHPNALSSPDSGKLPYDAGLYYIVVYLLVLVQYTPYNGNYVALLLVSKGGHGKTGTTAAMGNIIGNIVYAQVKNTSLQAAQGMAYCGFDVKML